MSDLLASSGDALGRVPSGYMDRHARTVWFGTGEARLASLVSKDRRYKPVVKSDGGQRESDGVVVPGRAKAARAPGKGPDFGHVGDGGKREGMTGTAPSNYPQGQHLPPAKVRQLQNRLWAAAKQSEGRRFHALYDRIHRSDVLWEAWERVRANRGAAGVDQVTLAAVEDYGVHRMLGELAVVLRAGRYRPSPVRRVEIPKPDGSKRPLGIPTVKDRVCQQAAKIVLEPLFEADFLPCSFGFRPKRSATDALERLRIGFIEGNEFVFEADIRDSLEGLRREDPDFAYEIQQPPSPDYRVLRVVMEATDIPQSEYIVQSVIRHYREVTGQDPKTVGTILPLSYGGDDICHLWRAGIPCVLYGPQGSEGSPAEPDNYMLVSEMVRCTQVLSQVALDVCNQST